MPRTHPNAAPAPRSFWADVAERAGKTFVQAFAATAGLSAVTDVIHVDWQQGLIAGGVAAAASVFTSFASAGVGPGATASLVTAAKVESQVTDVLARLEAALAAGKAPTVAPSVALPNLSSTVVIPAPPVPAPDVTDTPAQ